jgi:hypothetical protein
MAKGDEFSVQQINQEILGMVSFYGSIVSTPNVEPKTSELANKNLSKLVEAMQKDCDDLLFLKLQKTTKIKL